MTEKQKKIKNAILSAVLCVAVVASCLTFGVKAFARAQRLMLDIKYSDATSGEEDMIWYMYTPEISGTYSFLSFNVRHSEAYLFVKEVNQGETQKTFTQLAYSESSPDYKSRGQGSITQFCLTYHLEAGTTYYYTAGWWMGTYDTGTMNVMLTCDEYDNEIVERLEVSSTAWLDEEKEGEWLTDSAGERYFQYNYMRIINNLTVRVVYKDGSSTTVSGGADEIDGKSVYYTVDQSVNHWYPEGNSKYTGNIINVTLLDKSAQLNVTIRPKAKVEVYLKAEDYTTGELLMNAETRTESSVSSIDENGMMYLYLDSGVNTVTVTAPNGIPRTVTITVPENAEGYDVTATRVRIITGDYVPDGIINAKDFAYIRKHFTGSTLESESEKFAAQINFTEDIYDALSL